MRGVVMGLGLPSVSSDRGRREPRLAPLRTPAATAPCASALSDCADCADSPNPCRSRTDEQPDAGPVVPILPFEFDDLLGVALVACFGGHLEQPVGQLIGLVRG